MNTIKKRVGGIKPKYIITDDAPQYFGAWTAVFGTGSVKLLCAWHVDRSWRNLLTQKVKDKETRAATSKSLRVILEEMDRNRWIRCKLFYDKVVPELSANKETRSFDESFSKNTVQELESGQCHTESELV